MALALVAGSMVAASIPLGYMFMWRPFYLLHCCKRQAIPGFSIPWVSKPDEKDWAWSWKLMSEIKNHGSIFYIKFGAFVRLFVSDPVVIRRILVDNAACYEKGSFVQALRILGGGLFRIGGGEWAHQRSVLTPPFQLKAVKDHLDSIRSYTLEEMEEWNNGSPKKNDVDIHKKFLQLLVKLICHTAFDVRLSNSSDTALSIAQAFDSYLHNCRKMLYGPLASIPGYSFLLHHFKGVRKDKEFLTNMIRGFLCGHKIDEKAVDPGKAGKKILLDAMLSDTSTDARNALSEQKVLDNCMTFLMAGHETTASLLTWTTYLLALNPSWQEAARAELLESRRGADNILEDSGKVKIMTNILLESLRLFPPQPFIGRVCVEDNKSGHVFIPKRVEVIIPVYILHRDKHIWGEDADEFRPLRFARGIGKACNNPSAFLPFGSGPRTCIGQGLAMLEARTILALMLERYRWTLSPDYKHCPDITLTMQPRFGLLIILEKLTC